LAAVGPIGIAQEQDAPGAFIRVDTGRAGVDIPVFMHSTTGATATLLLVTGGGGGVGTIGANGWPNSPNFLIRSAPLFAAQGFHLALMARPTDRPDMGYPFRISADHMDDIAHVLRQVRATWNTPVWLVGTSRGTVSATAAAIALQGQGLIDGLVLTSSVVRANVTGTVPGQSLEKIKLPVLIVHHSQDACRVCPPKEVPGVDRALVNSPVHALRWVDGAEGLSGDPCETQHYHGFVGVEAPTVTLISDWIRHPGL
jgi:pimeloyl-ACP methyl ester carboxylesterase